MDEDEEEIVHKPAKIAEEAPRRRAKVLKFPRRAPSIVERPRKIVFITADKTTCAECICFPVEEPYIKPKKLKPCQMTPLTLYELAAAVVDGLKFPEAFDWSVQEVADWMADVVGLPQYRYCILDNYINGRRLMFLEDPSHMPMINIHYKEHIFMITAKVREVFGTEFIRFSRSVGLPPRLPLTHCTWFKSRTGPTWGIRQNWSRGDVLRWMKIINSEPFYMDHWDLVWYWPPDFPKTLLARIPPRTTREVIPHYKPRKLPPCREYLAPRKFRLQRDIPSDQQMIWLEHRPGSPIPRETALARERKLCDNVSMDPKSRLHRKKAAWLAKKKRLIKRPPTIPKPSRLDPPKIDPTGLIGKDLILARRLMPRKKFIII